MRQYLLYSQRKCAVCHFTCQISVLEREIWLLCYRIGHVVEKIDPLCPALVVIELRFSLVKLVASELEDSNVGKRTYAGG